MVDVSQSRGSSRGASPPLPTQSKIDGVSQGGTMTVGRFSSWFLYAIFLTGLVVRLIAVGETADVPTVRHLIGDAIGYVAWAERLSGGAWIGDESFYQAPLYPYTLGVLFQFLGSSVLVIRVVQCVWGAIACVFIAMTGDRLFGRRVGWTSGLMMSLYVPAIYYDGIVQKASLSLLLCCALVWGVAQDQARRRNVLVLGSIVGLLCLTRENALIWFLVLGCWVVGRTNFRGMVGRVSDGAIYGIGALIVLAPALAHNVYTSGSWSLTTSQSGPNFFIGNSSQADGRYRPLVRGHETPVFERRDATRLASIDAGRELTPQEVSGYWMRRAWADIGEDPVRWLGLCGRKLLMTVNAYEVADGDSLYVHAQSSWLLRYLGSVWHFGILLPLGVYGWFLSRRTSTPWLVYMAMLVSMAVGVAAFFVLGRYRLPLVAVLMPLAAYGLVRLIEKWRLRRMSPGMGVGLLVVTAVLGNLPIHDVRRLDGLAAMNAGVALAQMGELGAAQQLFADAVAAHPTSAEGNLNLAMVLGVQRRYREAIPYYRRALRVAPDLPGANFNLGVALERTGDRAGALVHYERAVAQDGSDTQARRSVERLRGSS